MAQPAPLPAALPAQGPDELDAATDDGPAGVRRHLRGGWYGGTPSTPATASTTS